MFTNNLLNGQDPEDFSMILNFGGGSVRMFYINGKPWWALKDTCRLIGLGNPSRTASRLEDYEKMTITLSNSHSGQRGGAQKLLVINEPGLYHLLVTSDKPLAKSFLRWITVEVIPSIRRNGGYILGQESMDADELMAAANQAIQNVLAEREQQIRGLCLENAELKARLCEWEPKVRYCDAMLCSQGAVPITVIAKAYGLTAQKLNRYLHDRRVQYKRDGTWVLYQPYDGKGYTYTYPILTGSKYCKNHTVWTPRGRFFIYLCLKEDGILPLSERPDVPGDIGDFWLL